MLTIVKSICVSRDDIISSKKNYNMDVILVDLILYNTVNSKQKVRTYNTPILVMIISMANKHRIVQYSNIKTLIPRR